MRSNHATTVVSAFVALLLAGCAVSRGTPVELRAAPAAISELAGEWVGEYHGIESGRSGSIQFTVVPGKDTAFGDVVMTSPMGIRMRAADDITVHMRHATSMEVLRVEFVAAEYGQVWGRLEPYYAPDCLCTVSTWFTGSLNGKRLSGTFRTHLSTSDQRGTWYVDRVTAIVKR